jgi:hypothetical protein
MFKHCLLATLAINNPIPHWLFLSIFFALFLGVIGSVIFWLIRANDTSSKGNRGCLLLFLSMLSLWLGILIAIIIIIILYFKYHYL